MAGLLVKTRTCLFYYFGPQGFGRSSPLSNTHKHPECEVRFTEPASMVKFSGPAQLMSPIGCLLRQNDQLVQRDILNHKVVV